MFGFVLILIHFFLSLFWRKEREEKEECCSRIWQHFICNQFHSFLAILHSQSSIMASFLCISLEGKRKDLRHGLFLAYGSRNDMLLNNGSWTENKIEVVVDRWGLRDEYHWHPVPTLRTYTCFYGLSEVCIYPSRCVWHR